MIPFPGMVLQNGELDLHTLGPEYVKIRLQLQYGEVKRIFGSRCKDNDRICACCKAWRQFDAGKKVEVLVHRNNLVDLLVNGDI